MHKPSLISTCWLHVGQCLTGSATAQTAEMIKTAAQPPDQRARFIEKSLNEFARLPSDETVRAFGMKLEPRMVEVRRPGLQTLILTWVWVDVRRATLHTLILI